MSHIRWQPSSRTGFATQRRARAAPVGNQRRRHGRINDLLNHRLQPTTHFLDLDVENWDDRSNPDDVVDWVSRTLETCGVTRWPFRPGLSAGEDVRHELTQIDFHFWQAPDGDTPEAADGGSTSTSLTRPRLRS